MFTVNDLNFPRYATAEIGHPWHPTAQVVAIFGKFHTFSSLINEIGKWSLPETLPANLLERPTLILLQGVFIIANNNMQKLVFFLNDCDSSPEVKKIFEMKYESGSEYFADLTKLLLQITNEESLALWSPTTGNFYWRVLKRFERSERVYTLIKNVHAFNTSINILEEFLKERDENNEKEKRDTETVEEERKGDDDEGYDSAQKLWEELEKHHIIEGPEEENGERTAGRSRRRRTQRRRG